MSNYSKHVTSGNHGTKSNENLEKVSAKGHRMDAFKGAGGLILDCKGWEVYRLCEKRKIDHASGR